MKTLRECARVLVRELPVLLAIGCLVYSQTVTVLRVHDLFLTLATIWFATELIMLHQRQLSKGDR